MRLHFKRRLSMSLVLVSLLVVLSSASYVLAEDSEVLQQQTNVLQNELDGINQEMVAVSDEIASLEMEQSLIQSEIMRLQDDLVVAQEEEDQQYEDMKTRIKFMYENGDATLLELLFSAEDLGDFLNKADFIQSISAYDREMLDELRSIREEISTKQEVLAGQQYGDSAAGTRCQTGGIAAKGCGDGDRFGSVPGTAGGGKSCGDGGASDKRRYCGWDDPPYQCDRGGGK